MGRPAKPSRVNTAYAPIGMRLERAASYLDISTSTFLRLIETRDLPPGITKGGMVIWDRYELEAAFENWKTQRKVRASDDATEILAEKPPLTR
jgi:predicted DNA-binding transcriptional regulator AlpA